MLHLKQIQTTSEIAINYTSRLNGRGIGTNSNKQRAAAAEQTARRAKNVRRWRNDTNRKSESNIPIMI